MVYLVYRLTFTDGSKYIGQTVDLNNRLVAHNFLWSKEHNIKIKDIDIVKMCTNIKEATAIESSLIEFYGIENLRNSSFSSLARSDMNEIEKIAEKLDADKEPDKPINVIFNCDVLSSDEIKLKFMQKKIMQLENRYMTTFFQYEAMKSNMKMLDQIIDEAVLRSFE